MQLSFCPVLPNFLLHSVIYDTVKTYHSYYENSNSVLNWICTLYHQDTNHLDVDVSKHKSALGKTGSMALRRKPSRKSRKSLLSTDEDALFRDSTGIAL